VKGYCGDSSKELSIHCVEKTDETGRLRRLNLAIRGIEGDFGPEHTNTFCRHLLPELRIPKSWRA
jgi:type I restriction enzyme M protein